MSDKQFARGLFGLLAFLMTSGLFFYGLYKHDWHLCVGVVSGLFGGAIWSAVREKSLIRDNK